MSKKVFNLVKNYKASDGQRVWLNLEVPKNETKPAQIHISGTIGKNWWDDSGTSGKEFREALNAVPAGQKIDLHINSEGGSVQDGLEIYNAVKERSIDITSHISGYAVSIASVIPLAASRVISPTSSVWMIHEPWSVTQGDSDEHLKAAEMLDKHGDMLASIYSEETGHSKKEMRQAMKDETWFTGEEACDFGLADETEEMDCNNALRGLDVKNFKPSAAVMNLISAAQAGGQPKPKDREQIMNKKIVVALLKKHGIEASETETDEQLQVKLDSIPKAVAQAKDPLLASADDDTKKAIAKIIKDRITDKVKSYVDELKITKDEIAIWVNAALGDEENTFKILDAKPAQSIGGAPAGTDFQVGETSLPAGLFGRPSPKLIEMASGCAGDRSKIYAGMKRDYNLLLDDARRHDKVKNENTFVSTFTTAFLILGATTKASPKFASVKMFSRDTSVDPYKPLASGILKYNTTVQDGSTSQTNPTTWESGDSVITPVTVTVAQYAESFHVTNGQLNSGLRMEDLVTAKMASLGSKISQVLAANITSANFATLTPVISAPTAFGFSDLATCWGNLKKANRKNIMLDGEYLAKIINSPTFLQTVPVVPGAGWENVIGWDYIALHTEWSTAGNNIRGFACDPQALGIITGLPLIDSPAIPGGILAQATGMIPGVELPIAAYAWFNTSTRTYWASYDLMFGANALDTTIGDVIASGTPS